MSNPWCTAPSDVALTPFKKTISDIEESHRLRRGRISTVCPPSSSSTIVNKKSNFIGQLREVDGFLVLKRQSEFHRRAIEKQPELMKALEIAEQLTQIFNRLSNELDIFNRSDDLKNSFINAFRTSQIIWDDISQENKAKLVNSIRSAIREIIKVFRTREDEKFRAHEKNLDLLIQRTNVFDERKEFDDYYLEDLYDLLTECSNSLEMIRLS
jgi:hypothetical protein